MAYSRPPVQPGRALKRIPETPPENSAGVFDFKLEADIASASSLGVVQVGTGLSITPDGILTATNGSSGIVNVTLVSASYTATASDSYIGATNSNITITLPAGVTGKIYYIKNQAGGNITLKGTGTQTINNGSSKSLGSEDGVIVIFAGTRWNVF